MKKSAGSLMLSLCLLYSFPSNAQQLNSLTCVVTDNRRAISDRVNGRDRGQ